MILVRFRAPRSKRWREWRVACELKLAILAKQNGPPYSIDEGLYKQCRDLLFAGYANKCAYCEGRLYEQSAGQVEHFRPKGGVRDLLNKVVKIAPNQPHAGYWWLAYEPSNLLPTCNMCNVYTRKMGGKGERFPLAEQGFRAIKPGDEKKEQALLIHPGREDPSKYLDLDFETGFLKSDNQRGQVTIDVLGLNRAALVEARHDAVDHATLHFRQCRRKKPIPKKDREKIADHLAGRKPYSLVWRKMRDRMAPKL